MKHRVLVADDESDARSALALLLSTKGYEVEEAADGKDALARALIFRPSVIISDLLMPGIDGLGLLRAVRVELPATAVILLTGYGTVETAVAAMREGAYDYVVKPVDPARLEALLEKAVEQAAMLQEVSLLRRQLRESRGLGLLLGTSDAMRDVYRLVERAAPTTAPVLIAGETGTGKELVARTIHQLSPRGKQPFVAVNCAAIPETLLESELFGHEKGAFTGALARRAGYFELADGGTIFLDEITEMSSALQAKYLRTLQDGKVRRLGGTSELTVDVRVIAATNRDPLQAVKDGRFREDLYYRLNVLSIALPPLRERKGDIPLLVESFIAEFNEKYHKQVASVDDPSLERLSRHAWPGNVRELRNVIERAVAQCDGQLITRDHLSLPALPAAARVQLTATGNESPGVVVLRFGTTLDEGERELLLMTLATVGHNQTRAAEILGTTPKTLYNRLRQYRLEKHPSLPPPSPEQSPG
jgi:DNA-binding NtrC family response regulator